MIFLIEYHREQGRMITLRRFDQSQRSAAHEARLELELNRHREGVMHEIVLLEAASEDALHKTHARYFKTTAEIAQDFISPERPTEDHP